MTLRVKLVISFTLLLILVVFAVGVVASRSIRSILVAQTDRTLSGFADRDDRPRGDGDHDDAGSPQPPDQLLQPFAELIVDPDGTVIYAQPSGFIDDPDPLPDVSSIGDESGFVYLDSTEGDLEYRAFIARLGDGTAFVRAAPLNDVATATSELIRTLLVAGAAVLIIGAGITWWMVRTSLAPVEEMVDTAEAIAAGDLTRRVPDSDPSTELGRLGGSLNEMLGTIEESIEHEREGQRRMRTFVADASHELRTPLTTIVGYSELHRSGGLESPGEVDKAWTRIESESRRMNRLVEDLLTLTRLGQAAPLRIGEVDIGELCRNAATDFAVADTEHPVTVSLDDVLVIRGDPERLHQVIANLLANVTVHTPPGTSVELAAEHAGDGVDITVTDDGPGLPEGSEDRVFDRFYRSDPSRSRRSGGSGLGLAIVQAIVETHGGRVAAESVDGGGARFTVHLPTDPRDLPVLA